MLSRFSYCSPPYKETLRATGPFVCKENFSLNQIVYNLLWHRNDFCNFSERPTPLQTSWREMVLILANDLPRSSKFKVYLDIVKLPESRLKWYTSYNSHKMCLGSYEWLSTWKFFLGQFLFLLFRTNRCSRKLLQIFLVSKRFFILYSPQDDGNPLGFPVFSRPVIALFSYK